MTLDERIRRAERALAIDPHDPVAKSELDQARARAHGVPEIKEPNRSNLASGHPDLETIASLSEPDMSYEFHLMESWRHTPTGRVFWGRDSGCSCPSPFENDWFMFDGVKLDTTLTELTEASRSTFLREVDNFPADFGDRRTFQQKTLGALTGRTTCDETLDADNVIPPRFFDTAL